MCVEFNHLKIIKTQRKVFTMKNSKLTSLVFVRRKKPWIKKENVADKIYSIITCIIIHSSYDASEIVFSFIILTIAVKIQIKLGC